MESILLAVVVKVGAEPPAHLIALNHVTVRLPVPSCMMSKMRLCPATSFESANVLFPANVTWWIFEVAQLKVTVAPSVSVVTSP